MHFIALCKILSIRIFWSEPLYYSYPCVMREKGYLNIQISNNIINIKLNKVVSGAEK